jgi:hypothetical protein
MHFPATTLKQAGRALRIIDVGEFRHYDLQRTMGEFGNVSRQ